MPRKQTGEGFLQRAISSVARLFHRGDGHDHQASKATPARRSDATARTARTVHRETDIPFDRIEQAYSPMQTSVKAGFRTSGADHQRDQEYARGVADDRWNDEDRFTNKSGDPRIGTHGRTYEPGEARPARARNDENK
jgi:hypothetical protein